MPTHFAQYQSLKRRIAERKERHEACGDLEGRLTQLVVKQLRREIREDRKHERSSH
jgi:hypothetical protein